RWSPGRPGSGANRRSDRLGGSPGGATHGRIRAPYAAHRPTRRPSSCLSWAGSPSLHPHTWYPAPSAGRTFDIVYHTFRLARPVPVEERDRSMSGYARGPFGVDWEDRIDFDRLRRHRVDAVRAA